MPTRLQILQLTLQALSSFAIAAGLIYTAIQFGSARKAQLVANFSKLVELQYQLRRLRVDNPSLASEGDTQHLHSDHEIQIYYVNLMQLSLFEIAWYAHKHRQIPDDYFDSWRVRIWDVAQEPAFRAMLNNPAMKIMHDEFASFVRRLVDGPRPG
jgi:hypothetical protein